MKRLNETIWQSDSGRPLLRCNPTLAPTAIMVIPAACSRDELRELGEAIADALKHTEVGE